MKGFVVIPTYNEKDNIARMVHEILALDIKGLSVLVVDDNSPDGTYAIVQEIADREPKVSLMRRMKRKGRGTAAIDGFKYVLDKGAEYIIEMDADFSHHPRHIRKMLEEIDTNDVVLGSRFVSGGKDIDRGLYRQLCTKLAGIYVRKLLKIDIKDVSSGFRCFRREVLERIDLDDLISTGPSIILEILYKVSLNGFKIKEIPIIFRDRRQGQTKLDYITLLETLVMVLRLRQLKKDKKI